MLFVLLDVVGRDFRSVGWGEVVCDSFLFFLGYVDRDMFGLGVGIFDHLLEFFWTCFEDENFDSCFVFVVATSEEVVDFHDGTEIGEELIFCDPFFEGEADHGSASESAADDDFVADFL